eukprot:gene9936-2257_t
MDQNKKTPKDIVNEWFFLPSRKRNREEIILEQINHESKMFGSTSIPFQFKIQENRCEIPKNLERKIEELTSENESLRSEFEELSLKYRQTMEKYSIENSNLIKKINIEESRQMEHKLNYAEISKKLFSKNCEMVDLKVHEESAFEIFEWNTIKWVQK